MQTPLQIEGTWEQIAALGQSLIGCRVRLTVLSDEENSVEEPQTPLSEQFARISLKLKVRTLPTNHNKAYGTSFNPFRPPNLLRRIGSVLSVNLRRSAIHGKMRRL